MMRSFTHSCLELIFQRIYVNLRLTGIADFLRVDTWLNALILQVDGMTSFSHSSFSFSYAQTRPIVRRTVRLERASPSRWSLRWEQSLYAPRRLQRECCGRPGGLAGQQHMCPGMIATASSCQSPSFQDPVEFTSIGQQGARV